nr:hypothetical protein [Tanacetum cinerariifolium]
MSSFNQHGCYGCGGQLDGLLCRRCTCEWCENNLRDGFCLFFNSRADNSFIYDSNPNSYDNPLDFSCQPSQPQNETYSYELCGNDSHYGYDCPTRLSLAAKVSFQYWKPPIFYDDDDEESSIPLRDIIYELPLSVAIAPDLPITNSLIMEDEHLNTISDTESDEENDSSVKELNLTPSESEDLSEDLSDNESECDVPVCDDSSPNFTTFSNPLFDSNDDFTYSNDESFSEEDVLKENFKIFSNPLFEFDEDIISSKIDPLYNEINSILQGNDYDHFNAESDLIESLLNRDTSMVSSSKIDSLIEEFSDELAHINLIPSGIDEADFDQEEDIRLVEKLLYDNSSPQPPEELNSEISDAIIESFSPSPIPIEDSDYLI